MLNSKFDLYKREWLDLVFTGRNKNYGAYQLRVHYDNYLLRAMAFTIGALVTCGVLLKVVLKPQDQTVWHKTIVDVTPPPVLPPAAPKKEVVHEAVIKHTAPAKPVIHTDMQKFQVPTPTNDPVPEVKFPPQARLTNPGTIDNKDDGTKQVTVVDSPPGTGKAGNGNAPAPSNDPVDAAGVDVMPEPTGGMAAWSKFLQRNIHYPDTDIEGRVYLSFVVEKDGRLSNITLIRGVSTLLDEEAMRVLKIAPAWKPGMQNGQAVRVKYTLPVVFQVSQ